jgi:hypothetical protein
MFTQKIVMIILRAIGTQYKIFIIRPTRVSLNSIFASVFSRGISYPRLLHCIRASVSHDSPYIKARRIWNDIDGIMSGETKKMRLETLAVF